MDTDKVIQDLKRRFAAHLSDSILPKQKASGKNIRKATIRWIPITVCSI